VVDMEEDNGMLRRLSVRRVVRALRECPHLRIETHNCAQGRLWGTQFLDAGRPPKPCSRISMEKDHEINSQLADCQNIGDALEWFSYFSGER
jgi:hypothetical protein